MEVILDTNIWVACLHDSDTQYEKALRLVEVIDEQILIPEYVLIEILNVVTTKIGKTSADNFISNLIASERVTMLWATDEFREELLSFFTSNKIERLSFVDQSLLFLSKKYKVVTFDKVLAKRIGR